MEFYTIDPNSDFIPILATKLSVQPDDLKKKIEDTWKRLEEAYNASLKKGTLEVYAIKTFPTRSIFMTDDRLIETPYQTAAGRARIPLYVYKKVARDDSPFEFACSDLTALKAEARLVAKHSA